MSAEPPLNVPALVEWLGKAVAQGAPAWSLGPAASRVAAVKPDDSLPDAEVLVAQAMVVLGVVACIPQGGVDGEQPRGLAHGRGEVGQVLALSKTWHGAEQESGVDQVGMAGASDHGSLYADESFPAYASARMRRQA